MTPFTTYSTSSARCFAKLGSVRTSLEGSLLLTLSLCLEDRWKWHSGTSIFSVVPSVVRCWVTKANESVGRDQYTELLDHLRVCYGPTFDLTSTSQGLVEFLLGIDLLQSRHHPLYLFKLCCLCATTPSPTYPDVTTGSITTVGHQTRFTDVILPCQSQMAGVSGSLTLCSGDSNLEKFSLLTAFFGGTAFSSTYVPWLYVVNLGRSKINKSLSFSYRAVLAGRKKVPVRSETEDSVVDESGLRPPPPPSKRRRMERSASQSSTSSICWGICTKHL